MRQPNHARKYPAIALRSVHAPNERPIDLHDIRREREQPPDRSEADPKIIDGDAAPETPHTIREYRRLGRAEFSRFCNFKDEAPGDIAPLQQSAFDSDPPLVEDGAESGDVRRENDRRITLELIDDTGHDLMVEMPDEAQPLQGAEGVVRSSVIAIRSLCRPEQTLIIENFIWIGRAANWLPGQIEVVAFNGPQKATGLHHIRSITAHPTGIRTRRRNCRLVLILWCGRVSG
ncbi:coatomer subunit gamma [Sphingopyxis sp. EG6]|nr:coatomer subunit gamma [Sphingopyxis sp. EG6]